MDNDALTLSEAARYLGFHPKTLQRLDRKGELKAHRTLTNRRIYFLANLKNFQNKRQSQAEKRLSDKITTIIRRHRGGMAQ